MNRNFYLSDGLGSICSLKRTNSEINSVNQENEFQINPLDKSFGLQKSNKACFHNSIETESSKDFFTNLNIAHSPIPEKKTSFLKHFAKRFDVLRKNVEDEDFCNTSLYANAQIKNEGLQFGTPDIIPFQQIKSNNSFNNQSFEKLGSLISENDNSGVPSKPEAIPVRTRPEVILNDLIQKNFKIKHKQKALYQKETKIQKEITHLQNVLDKENNCFISPILHRLYEVFLQIFSKGFIVPAEYHLKPREEEILNCLLQRKFLTSLISYELSLPLPDKIEYINDIIKGRSCKRPEECYKFILTRANKFLKRKLSPSNIETEESEKIFYQFYFGRLASDLDLPIEQFVYPITRKQIEVTKLNSNYFERVFKSQKYLDDVQYYIENHIFAEYKEELKKKLRSLLLKYEYMFQKNSSNAESVERSLKDYITKNKRCKLPWTLNEISESITRFQTLINSLKLKI
jgi:hypothetical protein